MSPADVATILALPVEERLRLIELIWESIPEHSREVTLSDAERKILEERLAEHERDPDDVITLDELLAQVPRRR